MTDPLSVFLRDLPLDTPRYPYVGYDDVREKKAARLEIVKNSKDRSPFLVFLNVPGAAFRDPSATPWSPVEGCHFTYSHSLSCLVIEILSPTHEAAKDKAISLLDKKIDEMGLYSSLRRPGPAARTYDDVTKQPDAQWLPIVPSEDPDKPTIMLEVATAVSERRAVSEAKRWLTYPKSPVMMVILIKAYDSAKIVAQTLTGYRKPQFSIAGTDMECTITRSNGTTSVQGTLVLPFEFIFWREKNKENPKEQDIVLGEQELCDFAEAVWKTQGLI